MWVSALFRCLFRFAAELPFIVAVLLVLYGITIVEFSSITTGMVRVASAGYRGTTMAVHSCIGFMGSFTGPLVFGITFDFASPSGVGGTTTQSWGIAFDMTGIVVALVPLFFKWLGKSRPE